MRQKFSLPSGGDFLLLLLEKLVILQIGHFVKKEGDEYGVSRRW